MMTKEQSLMMLTNLIPGIVDEAGTIVWSYVLLSDALIDPPRTVRWADIAEFELDDGDYERFVFEAEEIVGPEEWEEGHLLRFPQCTFPVGEAGTPARWVAVVAFGTLANKIVSLEKLGTLWNPATALADLKQVIKVRTRIPLP